MASRFIANIREALTAPRYYAAGVGRLFYVEQVFLWAGAIAFKVLVTFVPLLLLSTGITGLVLRRDAAFEQIASISRNFLPYYQSEQVIETMRALQQASPAITVVGSVGLLVTVVTLFTTLRTVVGNVFKAYHHPRPLLAGYAFDFRMTLQVGLLFLLSFGLTAAVRLLSAAGLDFLARIGLDAVWLQEGWRILIQALGVVIPFAITTMMFFQLYYFIPRPRPPYRSALFGAFSTAALWEIAKNLFALYATSVAGLDRYAAQERGLGPLGQIFGLIIALVFWVYFSGVLLIVGARMTSLHEHYHEARHEALKAANKKRVDQLRHRHEKKEEVEKEKVRG